MENKKVENKKVETINYNSFKSAGFYRFIPNYSIDIYVNNRIDRYEKYKNAINVGIMETISGSINTNVMSQGIHEIELPPDIISMEKLEDGYCICNLYVINNQYTKVEVMSLITAKKVIYYNKS